MIRIATVFWMILTISIDHSLAQTQQARDFIPKILPSSPEAASFTKYGNFHVNMYTGLPDISIPIYEIKIGELSIPISISYHASGIKVNDWGSWVGLGWNLNAGGSVSRRIMGLPDDLTGNYLSGQTVRVAATLNPNTQTDLDYLRTVGQGVVDVEPDIFSYSFPGKSGKFVFNQTNNFVPIMIPYDPVKVNFANGFFDLTDESGRTYQFHNGEYTTTSVAGSVTQGMSTWVLTQMISANKQDTIFLNYTQRSGGSQVSEDYRDFTILNDNVVNYQPNTLQPDMGTSYTDDIVVGVTEQKIQQISFPNGKIIFDASTADRSDGFTGQKSLTDIKIYSFDKKTNIYNLFKTVFFYQSYFINSLDNTVKRLRLDSVGIADANGNVIEKYKFNYNTSIELPSRLSRARDYWGYYNGKPNNTLVPQMQVPYSVISGPTSIQIGSNVLNSRDPDTSYMQAYMLQRIYFPTGGYTDFQYETNKYLVPPSTISNAGGLRVKSIKSYDGTNPTPILKSYVYGSGESGYGRGNFFLANYFFQTTQTNQFFVSGQGCDVLAATKRVRTFVSSPCIEMEAYDGSIVNYSTVTEYLGDGTTNIGKTIYSFNDTQDGPGTTIITGKPVLLTYYENRGQLIDKQVFKNLGNNTYQMVQETQNTYSAFPEQFYQNLGIVVFKTTVSDRQSGGYDVSLPALNNAGACNINDSQNYSYANYSIRTDDNKLTQTITYSYDQANPSNAVVTKTNYYYDNLANLQTTRIYTVNSLGDSIKIFKKYPSDFPSTTPYNTMLGLNILNKLVQEQKYVNTTQVSLQTNNYADKGNGNYLTDNITLQIAGNPVETRANFNSYDNRGNILEMQKTNDSKKSYIWDYQKVYPVAEVNNAPQNQIAYTSFETDGSGNWSFADTSRSTEAITGNKSFILNSGNSINYYVASGGIKFILSYWSKDGQVTIGGVTLVSTTTGPTKNGWTYYEHIINASTGNGLSLTASTAKTIDELRLYPATALMTTYTYSPLTGMTGQCSQNNTITYYTYDAYNRLKFIRDVDGNIVKTVEYHYQSNPNTGF